MSNKIALITGASRGLGKSMALHLAAQGIDVIFTYRTQQQEAENVAQQIQQAGAKSAALPLDVSQISTFADFRQRLEQRSSNSGDVILSIFWLTMPVLVPMLLLPKPVNSNSIS